MSRYRLRGRVGISDEPDPYSLVYEPASLTTDFHWEVGYDPARVTYFAELYDDNPDDDTDFPIEPGASELMKAIGEGSSVDTIEQLQADMDVSLLPGVAAALRGERKRHFAGQLGEPADRVRARWLQLRGVELRRHLRSNSPFLGRPRRSSPPPAVSMEVGSVDA